MTTYDMGYDKREIMEDRRKVLALSLSASKMYQLHLLVKELALRILQIKIAYKQIFFTQKV